MGSKIDRQFDDYLNYCAENWTASTVKTKRQLVQRFIKEMKIRDMTKVKNRDVVTYKSTLAQRGNCGKTINNHIDQVVAFTRFLGEEMEEKISLDRNKIKRAKERINAQVSFTDTEIEAIKDACKSPIEKLLIKLLFDTTLRISEVAKMKYKDISIDNSIKTKGKGAKDRFVFITDDTANEIAKWKLITNGDDEVYVFPSPINADDHIREVTVRKYINAPIRRANFEEGSAHAIRRSSITDMIDHGVDIFTVQTIAGHSDPETTRRYYATSRQKLLRKFREYQGRRAQAIDN